MLFICLYIMLSIISHESDQNITCTRINNVFKKNNLPQQATFLKKSFKTPKAMKNLHSLNF